MRPLKAIAIFPLLAAGLVGCASHRARTVRWDELFSPTPVTVQNTLIEVTYYCGSKEGFDYFVVRPPLNADRRYRVAEEGSRITKRFPFTTDRTKWRAL